MGPDCSFVAVDDPRPYTRACPQRGHRLGQQDPRRRRGAAPRVPRRPRARGDRVRVHDPPVVETFGRGMARTGNDEREVRPPVLRGRSGDRDRHPRWPPAGSSSRPPTSAAPSAPPPSRTVSASTTSVEPDRYVEAPLPEERVPATPEGLAGIDVLGSLEFGLSRRPRPRVPRPARRRPRACTAARAWPTRAGCCAPPTTSWPPMCVWARGSTRPASSPTSASSPTATASRPGGGSRGSGSATDIELVELDVLLVADGHRPVTHVGHTAIYRLRDRSLE